MKLQIRDGLPTDLDACLALDTAYHTDSVWQMHVQPDTLGQGVVFREGRLPRAADYTHETARTRLEAALKPDHCFLVATMTPVQMEEDHPPPDPQIIGLLAMTIDRAESAAWVHEIAVDRPNRRQGVATRLCNVALRWAWNARVNRVMAITPTKNIPAIRFWQKQGFTFCGWNDHWYRSGDIAVFFAQVLR